MICCVKYFSILKQEYVLFWFLLADDIDISFQMKRWISDQIIAIVEALIIADKQAFHIITQAHFQKFICWMFKIILSEEIIKCYLVDLFVFIIDLL